MAGCTWTVRPWMDDAFILEIAGKAFSISKDEAPALCRAIMDAAGDRTESLVEQSERLRMLHDAKPAPDAALLRDALQKLAAALNVRGGPAPVIIASLDAVEAAEACGLLSDPGPRTDTDAMLAEVEQMLASGELKPMPQEASVHNRQALRIMQETQQPQTGALDTLEWIGVQARTLSEARDKARSALAAIRGGTNDE